MIGELYIKRKIIYMVISEPFQTTVGARIPQREGTMSIKLFNVSSDYVFVEYLDYLGIFYDRIE